MEKQFYGQFDPPIDKFIQEYFSDDYIGGCIDVGAFDGKLDSNTARFEDKGWYTLCIEPNPNLFEKLSSNRLNVIKYAIGSQNIDNIPFHVFDSYGNEGAISALKVDHKLVDYFLENNTPFSQYTISVDVRTLDWCIENHYWINKIDFVSIDTEGTELDVLKGFSIEKWKPKLLIIENNFNNPNIEEYLLQFGYIKDKRYEVNDFFIQKNSLN